MSRLGPFFLVLAHLLAGCANLAPGNHYALTIDPTLSLEDQSTATEAAHAWVDALHGELTIDVAIGACSSNDREICVLPTYPGRLMPGELANTTRYFAWDRADTYISPDSTGLTTITHELGHAMGLVHTGPGTVMCFATGCAAERPTHADAAQWRQTR